MASAPQKVVVLGGGVIGSTTALVLAERGYDVTLVARDLPTDLKSQAFASPWAGANWHSFPGSSEQINKWERYTYKVFQSLIPTGLTRMLPWIEFSKTDTDTSHVAKTWYNDLTPDHEAIPVDELPKGKGYLSGARLTILSLAPAQFLPWLYAQLQNKGVKIVRRKVESLEEAAETVNGKVECVVNATGLGAASLVGCLDEAVHPIRGQTVLVRAPWIKTGMAVKGEATPQYLIPRTDGNIILGGTRQVGNWDTSIDLETAEFILKNAYEMCPELSHGQGWEKIQVISHNVGLRPGRHGGPRMELERLALPLQDKKGVVVPGLLPFTSFSTKRRTLGVVHAYGHASAGWQSSAGVAENAAQLVDEHFANLKANGVRTRDSKL